VSRIARLILWSLGALVSFVLVAMFARLNGIMAWLFASMLAVWGIACLIMLTFLVWLIVHGGMSPAHDMIMLALSLLMFAAPTAILLVWTSCKGRRMNGDDHS